MSGKENLLNDLSFGPAWARQPADQGAHISLSGQGSRPRRGPERERSGRPPPARRRHAGERSPRNQPARGAPPDGPRRHAPDVPDTAVDGFRFGFIPERRGLKPLVMQLARTRRAWPLTEVARMFLSKPEFYAVKIEVAPLKDADRTVAALFQCQECLQPFQNRAAAVTHVLNRHFDGHYAREEKQVEPPKGDYNVVARCRLSGVLLGPPNFHLYNEKILELHRARFADMPLDAYRRNIVNESDPEFIEKWRREVSVQVEYHALPEEAQGPVFTRRAEAEAHFMSVHVPGLIRESTRLIVPGKVVANLEDADLGRRIRQLWARETRAPLRITLAVRPAFRQLGLHLFRDRAKNVFVSSIAPRPLAQLRAAPAVAFILEYLSGHPGVTGAELLRAWQEAGRGDDAELKRQLHWLIDRGHVIEYFNSVLEAPAAEGAPASAPDNMDGARAADAGDKGDVHGGCGT